MPTEARDWDGRFQKMRRAPLRLVGRQQRALRRAFPGSQQMTMPRLAPWWSGPGLLYALWGALWAYVRRFAALEYRDTAGHLNRSKGLQMAFVEVLLFVDRSALPDTGEKMPPAGRSRPHKRRETAGEYRGIAAYAGRLEGVKKPAPVWGG